MSHNTNNTRGVIWKFDLANDAVLELPAGAKVLSVGWQKPSLRLWALVDPEVPKVRRKVKALSTGHELIGEGWEFAGTVQAPLDLVYHVFLEII